MALGLTTVATTQQAPTQRINRPARPPGMSVMDYVTRLAKANPVAKRTCSTSGDVDQLPSVKTRDRHLGGAVDLPTPEIPSSDIKIISSRRCFFQVGSGRIVGSIRNQKCWKAFMYMDGGRAGGPTLELRFRANNQSSRKNKPVLPGGTSEHIDHVAFRFRPGVRSQPDPMLWTMENYETYDYAIDRDNRIFPSSIVGTLSASVRPSLMAFRFRVHGNASNGIPRQAVWARYARSGVVDAMRPMLNIMPSTLSKFGLPPISPRQRKLVEIASSKRMKSKVSNRDLLIHGED